MHAVTFVLPDEMAGVLISGLQWFILIPRLNHTGSHRPIDSHSKLYLHQEKKKYRIWNKNYPACYTPTNYGGKQLFVSDFSPLLRHAIEKGRGPILYSKNTPGPHGDSSNLKLSSANPFNLEESKIFRLGKG